MSRHYFEVSFKTLELRFTSFAEIHLTHIFLAVKHDESLKDIRLDQTFFTNLISAIAPLLHEIQMMKARAIVRFLCSCIYVNCTGEHMKRERAAAGTLI